MSAFNKFNSFVEALGRKLHNLNADALKVMLTNSAPVAGNSVKANLTEISAGSGYTAGGTAMGSTAFSQSGGTATLIGNKVTFTAAGGSIGPFRYAVLYNDTASNDELIGWWDYGSNLTLADGESIDVKPSNADTGGTVLTVA